ncbi:hypothetical protein [uncultured Porphyromonas sp.]|uniref:hypothetical protein n=1 Tax=uncultured Porphyromonas sp. TaxID=159274 RepID=UPI00261844DD|nr:hypothetical protein [uncultured Porphyromonas sp.]
MGHLRVSIALLLLLCLMVSCKSREKTLQTAVQHEVREITNTDLRDTVTIEWWDNAPPTPLDTLLRSVAPKKQKVVLARHQVTKQMGKTKATQEKRETTIEQPLSRRGTSPVRTFMVGLGMGLMVAMLLTMLWRRLIHAIRL